jgi:hypothetical protein
LTAVHPTVNVASMTPPPLLLAMMLALVSSCSTGGSATYGEPVAENLPMVESGFLTTYTKLKPTQQSASVLFWRDPTLKRGYRKLLFRPVQVWRGADKRLDDIPESDLQYLADSFYDAMTERLADSFELVRKPGPNVLEIGLALTLVTKPNQRVDVFSTDVPVGELPERSSEMNPATIMFVRECAVEAEFSVAQPLPKKAGVESRQRAKRVIKAAVFDKRRGHETSKGSVRTWDDVDDVFDRWAEVLDSQLEGLKDGTFKPKLTVSGAQKAPAESHR